MAFFNSAVNVLQTLVIALGAGLGIWGVINDEIPREQNENQYSHNDSYYSGVQLV